MGIDIKQYKNILKSQVTASIGETFLMIALATTALQITGSPIQAAWIVSINALATFTIGIFSGGFIDKFPKKNLMLFCDIVRAVLLIPMFLINEEYFWITYFIVFLIGCCNAVFHPSREGYIQSQFKKEERINIITSIQSYLSTISLIGPTVAGILIALLTPNISFFINILAFTISAYYINKIPKDATYNNTSESFLIKITSGWTYLYKNKPLLKLNINRIWLTSSLAIYVIVNYSYLAELTNSPFFSLTLTFPILLGLINSIQGLGALSGGVLIKKIKNRFNERKESLLVYSGMIFSIGFLCWAIGNVYLIVFGSFLIGLGLIMGRTGISIIGQDLADSKYIGRAITAGDALARISHVSVTSLTSILIIYFSPRLLICISALLAIIITLNYVNMRRDNDGKSTNYMYNS